MADKTNGNSKKRELTAQKIIKAIKESNGLLTMAAKRAGVGYTTLWRYTQDFPSVKEAVYQAKESMLDFAEGKLYTKIKDGDNTAIIFYLKTQGKSRGYIERQEVTGEGGKDLIPKAPNILHLAEGGVFEPPLSGNGHAPSLIEQN